MTDTPDSTPPFPGFPGFPPAEMLDRMWGMMRLSPFGSAFAGGQPTGSLGPSLSMMSDMMAPLTNVEELDKRITDMRAVEQWLKLNLSMLQSAIQALEVQRATLATLRAFGAFAQSSMAQPAASAEAAAPAPAAEPSGDEEAPAASSFDASAWWNLLQSQFNQIAQFATAQSAAVADAVGAAAADSAPAAASASAGSRGEGANEPQARAQEGEPAGRRPAAKRAPAATKRSPSSAGAAPKAAKKPV
ncbi:MAG TPA: PhaM family polyhydroxyalkanoate granule multifunctional regulatory protein [Paraburkholderia sp.]